MNTSTHKAASPRLEAAMVKPMLNRWLATGTMASLLSMLVLAWHGRRRHGSSTALINSPSHIVHGDRALRANAFSMRFTLLGALIHHLSSMFWAVVYEGFLRAWRARRGPDATDADHSASRAGDPEPTAPARPPSVGEAFAAAAALSTLAWVVDTRLVPPRLTPGFERRASSTGMLMIYSGFGLGLAAGALMISRGRRQGQGGKTGLYPVGGSRA